MTREGFPGSSYSKESSCSAGDPGLIPELGISPGGRHGPPLQYSCLENPHGQRSLMGYSPWGHIESDTTEQLTHARAHMCTQTLLQTEKKATWLTSCDIYYHVKLNEVEGFN